jgi:hypothetical protein
MCRRFGGGEDAYIDVLSVGFSVNVSSVVWKQGRENVIYCCRLKAEQETGQLTDKLFLRVEA